VRAVDAGAPGWTSKKRVQAPCGKGAALSEPVWTVSSWQIFEAVHTGGRGVSVHGALRSLTPAVRGGPGERGKKTAHQDDPRTRVFDP
jgi:hypothetical protein